LGLIADQGKWRIPVKAVSCLRERNGRQEAFYLSNSDTSLAISIESPFLKLPKRFADDIERNFDTPAANCKVNQASRLTCDSMTAVDLALNFIQFKIDDGAFINISLYDLKLSYDEKTKETVFFVEFVESENDVELGESLFKSYYVSIDMENKKMLYSPINRFPSYSYGVYIIRFMIGFALFTVVVAFVAMIWQMFSDPLRKNKVVYGQDGVKLINYQRTNELDE
jgi:hypothetical protein